MFRRFRFNLAAALLFLGAATLGSRPARAQPAPAGANASQTADEFFRAGKAAYQAGRLQEAYEAYRSAWNLKHTYDIAGNLANTESQLGKMRDAVEHFAFCIDNFPPTGNKAQLVSTKARFDEARREVGAAMIQVNVSGAEVLVDGASIGKAPLPGEVYLDPGTRTIEARLSGYTSAKRTLEVAKGSTQPVMLKLAVVAPPPPGSGHTVPPPVPERRSMVPGAVLGGVAGAALITGIGLVASAASKRSSAHDINQSILQAKDSCVPNAMNFDAQCSNLASLGSTSDTFDRIGVGLLIGAGAAAVGSAAYFLWPESKPTPPSTGRLRVLPMVSPAGGGLVASGAF